MAIAFRPELDQTQRKGIEALASKPLDKWTPKDRENWSYATNNSPIPSSEEGGSPTQASARQQWVDDLYRKHFDRAATDVEMAEWSKHTPEQLTKYLGEEAKRYGYVSQGQQAQQQTNVQGAYSIIDSDAALSPEMKTLARALVDAYQGGVEPDIPQILATFNSLKKTVIDPKYQDLIRQTEGELKGAATYNEQQRALELEQENANADANIRNTKENLEQRGLTHSGEAVRQLGDQSAYNIQPFGGNMEGAVPQANRLVATSSSLRSMETLRQLGLQAEKQLGSAGVTGKLAGYKPMGGITGSIPTARTTDYSNALSQIDAEQNTKTDSLTDVKVNLTQ